MCDTPHVEYHCIFFCLIKLINRPGVAGPTPHTMCYVSHVTCNVSLVMCHMSPVTFHISYFLNFLFNFYFYILYDFFYPSKNVQQSGGASRMMVSYQRGLPRLVFFLNLFSLVFKQSCDASWWRV